MGVSGRDGGNGKVFREVLGVWALRKKTPALLGSLYFDGLALADFAGLAITAI